MDEEDSRTFKRFERVLDILAKIGEIVVSVARLINML